MPISPLSLTAGAGLYQNQGIQLNATFTTNRASYESTSLISDLLYVIDTANTLGVSTSTLGNLKTLGANVTGNFFPALGDSLPSNLTANVGNAGLVANISDTGNSYVSSTSAFVQMFSAAQGYVSTTNDLINSAVNANNYLGPTFTNMDDLISGDLSRVNLAFVEFGGDLQQLGQAVDPANYGTPAALLQQIARQGNLLNGLTPALEDRLIQGGLTSDPGLANTTGAGLQDLENRLLQGGLTRQDIADLVNNNVQSLFNPQGLTQAQFDSLQKRAYPGLVNTTGADLQDILDILGVTTPNINTLADLLNPIKIFPTSWPSLTMYTPNGPILIYNPDATVNSAVTQALATTSLIPQACDQLAKIIPPEQAVANQALIVSFSQVKNIGAVGLPQLAEAVR